MAISELSMDEIGAVSGAGVLKMIVQGVEIASDLINIFDVITRIPQIPGDGAMSEEDLAMAGSP